MKKILFSLILLLIGSYQIAYSNKPADQAKQFSVKNSSEKEAHFSLEKEKGKNKEKPGILATFFMNIVNKEINRYKSVNTFSSPLYSKKENEKKENKKSSALKSFLKRTLEKVQYNISVNAYAAQTKPTKNLPKAEAVKEAEVAKQLIHLFVNKKGYGELLYNIYKCNNGIC